MVKVKEKLSSVSSAPDFLKALFDEAMPCGISSLLVQVTVVPAFTVSVCGPKEKLSIDTMLVGPSARANNTLAARSEPTAAPSTVVAIRHATFLLSLGLEQRVANRERPCSSGYDCAAYKAQIGRKADLFLIRRHASL